ncbi:MAG: amidohydrolase, partial [Duncaniella sp.]|nr:amidohydrolase [Duncaniella sp.]
MLIIDAHSHLWLRQDTVVYGSRIRTLAGNGSRSEFFGEERQMLPPFMIDGRNTAEVFLSNMDYAQVAGAVVVQELIDGNQNEYLAETAAKYSDRLYCMGMASTAAEAEELHGKGFKGIAIAGH